MSCDGFSVSFCHFQEERAQQRLGRRKLPPVISASLEQSATWTQRMFGECARK